MAIPEEASNVIAWSSLDQLYKSLLCRIWLLDFLKFQGMPFPNRSITITIVQWLKHAKYSYKEGKGSIKKNGKGSKVIFFGGIFCGGSHTHTPPTLMFSEWTKQPPFLLLCRFRHSKSCLFCPKITVIVRKVWICCKRFRGRFDHFSDSDNV